MSSPSSRARATTRRSPRSVPRPSPGGPPTGRRPLSAAAAAVSGVLVAAEDLYLAYLLWEPDPGWHWFVVAFGLLAAWAGLAAAVVWRGRSRGWLVLAGASLVPLLLLLGLAVLFGVLGGGEAMWWALLLLVGPLGALVLAVGRPVREWTRPGWASAAPGIGSRGPRAG